MYTYFTNVLKKFVRGCSIILRNGLYATVTTLLTHKLSEHLIENRGTHYILHYPYGVSWYKLHLPKQRGPCNINLCTDIETGANITSRVREYLGPSHNFHGHVVTPKMLEYKSIKVGYTNGCEWIYSENDIIQTAAPSSDTEV